jgi:hypothetical protein
LAGRVFLGAMLVTTLALLTVRAGFIPFWDGRIYAECIVDAGERHVALSTLRCVEHISHAYMLYAGALQMLSPGSFPLMLLANVILYLLACAAFYRLAQLAFPSSEHALERALLTAAFAAQPAVLASVVQPNIDLPMLPAFLWGTVFIIRRRWLALILVGTALIATKESGVLLYVTLVFSYAIAMVLPKPSSSRSPIRALVHLAPLAIPAALFVAYIAYRAIVPHETVIWAAGTTEKSIIYQFLVPRIDRYFVNYLAMMLVLSFAWVAAALVGADTIVGIVRKWRKQPARPLPGAKRRIVRFLIVLGVVTMYALTRFSSWGNSRYLLPVFALTPLMLYAAVVRFGVRPSVRRPALGALAVLLLISTVRTIDPVSRAFYGTWAFGDHRLLRMTRVTHECCGAGRDQLVYNLQYTHLGNLTSDATAALATDSTVVFVPHRMMWETLGPLDRTTHRRTLRRQNVIRPLLYEPDTLATLRRPPSDAIYIGLPNGDPEAGLRMLGQWYDVGAPRRMQRGGYWLNAYRLTLRSGGT